MMVLLHLLGSGVNQRIQTSSAHAIHPLFFSQVTAHINSGSCISEGDKDVFLEPWPTSIQEATSVKEIRLCFGTTTSAGSSFNIAPKKQRFWRTSRLFMVFPSWRSWSLMTLGDCRMSVVWQFASNCLHCCKSFHSLWVIWRCWGIWYILPFG